MGGDVRRARGNCTSSGRQRLLKWAKRELDGEYTPTERRDRVKSQYL